jgi:hypothetical protein
MSDANDTASDKPEPKLREVRYRHSFSFVDVLRQLGATLLVSTYQAGKLGAISAGEKGDYWLVSRKRCADELMTLRSHTGPNSCGS